VQIPAADVMSEPGKLTRAFPGPAVTVPNTVAGNRQFVNNISEYIAQMDTTEMEAAPGEKLTAEDRETPHPVHSQPLLLRSFTHIS
jgi:hypothetical protein